MASIAIQTVMDALLEKFGDADGNISIPQDELAKALKTMKTTGRVRKTRPMRDPDAPKRPTSSYMLWLNENRAVIADDYFPKNDEGEHCYPEGHDNAGDPLKGRSKVAEITKKAGALWKDLSDEEKAPFIARQEEDKERYEKEMEDYTPSEDFQTKEKTKSKSKFDITQRPDATEGWTGHHEAKYLPKVAKDPETGKNIKSFKDFDEAIAKANELGDGCGGITMTSTGFSLRVGPDLRENPKDTPSGLASWTKSSNDVFTAETDDEEVEAPKKVSKKKASKKENVNELIKVVDGAKKDFEEEQAKKAKKAKKATKKKEPEPEPKSDSEDESDEEEMEVEQITINDAEYFLNEKTGDIFDPETQEVVGKSEDGEHTLFNQTEDDSEDDSDAEDN